MRRNQLAYISTAGWADVVPVESVDTNPSAADCLAHWRAAGLPLVVTRQPCDAAAGREALVALGLPAPLQWGRRPLGMRTPAESIARLEFFPAPGAAIPLLPSALQSAFTTLCTALEHAGIQAHVYGGYGWQLLTGLDYLRATSDIDLSLQVRDVDQADEAAQLVSALTVPHTRIDAELSFPDGRAVAALEWQRWRQGRVSQILVRSLRAVTLQAAPQWEAPCLSQ
jgi:phosphoribosyl-dephospho-CoA transferase